MSRKKKTSTRSGKPRGTSPVARSAGAGAARFGRLRRWATSDFAWVAGLTLLAWVHRVLFLLSNRDRDWPFTIFYQGDAQAFFLHARALLAGQPYDEGIPFHPPGFPLLLSAVHWLFGASGAGPIPHRSIKIFLALVSSAAVGFLFLLAKPYLGRAAAAVGSLLLTYHFGHYVLSIAPVGEGVFLTLLLATLCWWTRRFDHPLSIPRPHGGAAPHRRRDGLALGLLGGALALLRFESVLLFGGLVVLGLFGDVGRRRRGDRLWPRAGVWVAAVAGWWLVVSPWTLRNYKTLSDFNERMAGRIAEPLPTFVPVTIYGPINLALANQAGATGGFSPEALTGATGGGSLDLTRPKHLEWLLHGDRIAWRWIAEHPGDFAALVLRKWHLAGEVFSLGFLQGNVPGGLDGVRRPIDIFVPENQSLGWLMPIVILGGLGVAMSRGGGARRYLGLVALVGGCFLITTALFYGYVRLALLVLPLGLAFAGSLVEGLVDALRRRGVRPEVWCWGVAALIVGLLAVEAASSRADRNFKASASSTVDGHHLNPDDEILLELIED
ncbi:MAG: glycosyltransferase family 39 protein [Acidobacteriota bacterium]